MPEKSQTELIQFYAQWCGPCQAMKPIVAEIEKELGDKIKITRVNVDENPETAQKYNVMSIPTFLIKKNGEVKEQLSGVQTKNDLMKKLV